MAKAKKSKPIEHSATLELRTDDGFSWTHWASDIEFCTSDELIGYSHHAATMSVRRWRIADGATTFDLVFTLAQEALDRYAVSLQSIDDDTLLWRGRDGAPALLDPRTLDVRRALPESEGAYAIVFAARDAIVYIEGDTVRVFDLATLRERARYAVDFGAASIAMSSQREHIVATRPDGSARLFSVRDGAVRDLLTAGPQGSVTLLDRSELTLSCDPHNARSLRVASVDGSSVEVIDCRSYITRTAAPEDESCWLAVGSDVHCVEPASKRVRWSASLDVAPELVVFSRDARWIAAVTGHRVALIEAATGAVHRAYGPAHSADELTPGDGVILAAPSRFAGAHPHAWVMDERDPSRRARAVALRAPAAAMTHDRIALISSESAVLPVRAALSPSGLSATELKSVGSARLDCHALDAEGSLFLPSSQWVKRSYVHGVEKRSRNEDGRWSCATLVTAKKSATALCVVEDARELIVGWAHKELMVIDKDSGAVKRSIRGFARPVKRIVATKDGAMLAVHDGVNLSFVKGDTLLSTRHHVQDFAWTKDERWLLAVEHERVDRIDPETGERRARAILPLNARSIAVTKDREILVGALDTNVYRVCLPEAFWVDA